MPLTTRFSTAWALALALGAAPGSVLGQTQENFLDARDRLEWQAGGLYDGRFDDGTHFQIQLAYPRPAALTDKVMPFAEAYWYPKHLAAVPFALTAGGGDAGQRHLVRQAPGAAAIEESFTVALAPDRLTGHGTWRSSTLHKTMAFTLQRAIVYQEIVVQRPGPPEVRQEDPPRNFIFSASFPVLGNVAADAWIRARARACNDNLECANSVHVTWASPALLSLSASVWGYSHMAAHGNGHSVTRQYRVDNGRFTPLGLDAFIDPGPACTARITASIVEKLHAGEHAWADDWAKHAPLVSGKPKFTPTQSGIAFRFDPYEVGPYVEGASSIFLPRAQIGNCLRMLPVDG